MSQASGAAPRRPGESLGERGDWRDHGGGGHELDRVGDLRVDASPGPAAPGAPTRPARPISANTKPRDPPPSAPRRPRARHRRRRSASPATAPDEVLVEQQGGEHRHEAGSNPRAARSARRARRAGGRGRCRRTAPPVEAALRPPSGRSPPSVPRPGARSAIAIAAIPRAAMLIRQNRIDSPGRVPDRQRPDDEAAAPHRDHHRLGESKPRSFAHH